MRHYEIRKETLRDGTAQFYAHRLKMRGIFWKKLAPESYVTPDALLRSLRAGALFGIPYFPTEGDAFTACRKNADDAFADEVRWKGRQVVSDERVMRFDRDENGTVIVL